MRLRILLFLFSVSFALSCDEDPGTPCSVANPVEDLDWLAAEISLMEESGMSDQLYVTQARYGLMPVFLFRNCCASCNSVVQVFNCSGDLVGALGTGPGSINPNLILSEVVIWKTDNSTCYFQ